MNELAEPIAVVVMLFAFVILIVSIVVLSYRARIRAPLKTAELLARLQVLAVEQVENQRKVIQRLDRMAEALDALAFDGGDEPIDHDAGC